MSKLVSVTIIVAFMLGTSDAQSEPGKELVYKIQSKSPVKERKAALDELEKMGPKAEPALAILIESVKSECDRYFVESLAEKFGKVFAAMGDKGPDSLSKAFNDSKVKTERERLLWVLIYQNEKILIPLLDSKKDEEVHLLMDHLHKNKNLHAEVIKKLTQYLDSKDVHLVQKTTRVLAEQKTQDKKARAKAIKVLGNFLKNTDKEIYGRAYGGLMSLGSQSEDLGSTFADNADHPDIDIGIRCIQNLQKLGPKAEVYLPKLIKLIKLSGKNSELQRTNAIGGLLYSIGTEKSKKAQEFLRKAVKEKRTDNEAVQKETLAILGIKVESESNSNILIITGAAGGLLFLLALVFFLRRGKKTE
ncbi:MAG: hypothetical protein P1V97_34520 [Planctomycetota bacterium]|nr:hypothetical protein [Planctomycetota bacterium]